MGVVGGYLYSVNGFGIDRHFYWYNSAQFVGSWDFFSGVTKSFFFGATIALIGCYRGFNCKAGAEGVGNAATAAFVHSFVLILVEDFFLNVSMDSLYYLIWPEGVSIV
jgi:phospholipid/cholesterol/gamma-HCH transport system permease protein